MTKTPYILFRVDQDNEPEYEIAKDIWGDQITRFRSEIPEGSLVIGRYSCLPFYKDLEDELEANGSMLVNSYKEHKHIADMEWYNVLRDPYGRTTPKTFFDAGWQTVPDTEHGYVVKGRTNSRKFKWKSHMYAPDREALKDVMHRLYDDPLIADQGLVIREYVPLRQFEEGINGVPITNEWRCFFYGDQMVASGFYWSIAECADNMGELPKEARDIANKAGNIYGSGPEDGKPPFFVVDVAERADGGFTVIELNDGQQSGLSMIDPRGFYQALWDVFNE